jgi:lipopolysaccharide/colanic/teichoic acid biosynthesis glycosyltransferase
MTDWRPDAAERMTRLGDVVIACILLAITLPLMVVMGLAIKLESSGPVLDRETIIGSGGRRFRMLKFRTTAQGPQHRAAPWAQYPTRVGLFLEQTRIEHLPQLINVLRGEMRLTDSYLFD